MRNSNVRKGSIRIMDEKFEISIPDINNQANYYINLLKQSGFNNVIIGAGKSIGGDSICKLNLRLKEADILLYLTDSSCEKLVSYDFELIAQEKGFNLHQIGVILDHIMSLFLYGERTNKKEMVKEIMNGTKVSQNKLLITEY